MTTANGGGEEPRPAAEDLFAEFVRRWTAGEPVDLERDYCQVWPDRAHALRALASEGERTWAAGSDGDTKLPDAVESAMGADPEFRIGAVVNNYELRERIGGGSFGDVFRARQKDPVRDVALKVLRPGLDSRAILNRFGAERQALAVMAHPGIATIFDAGMSPRGRSFFVMEYVPGRPLTEFCDAEGLGIRQRLALFVDICDAVKHAHNRGIIHRDLKPSNVLAKREDGGVVPKIIDFGLAKALHHQLTDVSVMTQPDQLLGTPVYMSPEQAESTPDIDVRTSSR